MTRDRCTEVQHLRSEIDQNGTEKFFLDVLAAQEPKSDSCDTRNKCNSAPRTRDAAGQVRRNGGRVMRDITLLLSPTV